MDKIILFDKITVVGPDMKAGGGMAEVLKFHKEYIMGDKFDYLQSNDRRGTAAGLINLAALMLKLPVRRFKGKKLLHIHSTTGKSFYRKLLISAWARLWGYRIIIQWHGGKFLKFTGSPVNSYFLRLMGSLSDGFICLSEYWKDIFGEFLPDKKLHIVNNAVTLKPGNREKQPVFTILFMSAVNQSKGIYDLIDTLATIKELDWRLVVAGRGEIDKVSAYSASHSIENKIIFAGWIEGEEKADLLSKADLFVLPSYADAFPMAILEAMQSGLPVISTKVGSIPEMVNHGHNGFIIEPGDTEALATHIKNYISDRNLMELHGNTSRKTVELFSPEKIDSQLNDVYRALLIRK